MSRFVPRVIAAQLSQADLLNANFTDISNVLDKLLSRVSDPTNENVLLSDLDMNSDRIFNLPKALSATEPLRLKEFQNALPNLSEFLLSSIGVNHWELVTLDSINTVTDPGYFDVIMATKDFEAMEVGDLIDVIITNSLIPDLRTTVSYYLLQVTNV